MSSWRLRTRRNPVQSPIRCAAAVALLAVSTACEGTSDTIAVPREQPEAVPQPVPDCPGPVVASEGVVALYTFDQDEGRP